MPARQRLIAPDRPSVLLGLGWYSVAIHRGIAKFARRAHWILDTRMTRDGRVPADWQGDGVITLLRHDTELVDFARHCRKPVVNIGDLRVRGVPNVRCDDAAIGRLAADHFISRGFRHTAFYRRTNDPSAIRRGHAFGRRLRQADITCHALDASAQEHPVSWLGQRLADLPRPLAVFAEHDEIAIEALHACHDRGIPVPEQVAVLGVDDDPLRCDFAPVPLSSIDNNQEAEGYQAAALLDRLLRGEPAPAHVTLVPPVGLTTRLSTDILAVKHAHVAAALHHIWQNYPRPINAKTVAATIPLSYRRLHDAFREEVGRTIAEEIMLKRLEKAQKLLAETAQRARDVAEASGFSSEDRMGRVFKRVLGQTPLEYRKRNNRAG